MAEEIKNLDIEKIMSEIRENIKERGYTEKELTFAKFADDYKKKNCVGDIPKTYNRDAFENNLRKLDEGREITPWKLLVGNKIKVFIQKVIRKSIRFYVDPIVDEQNRNNYLITCLISQLEAKGNSSEAVDVIELQSQIKELKKEVASLKERLGE